MSQITRIADWLLRQPLLWGSLASLGFYALLLANAGSLPLVNRYFNGHVVEWVSTQLFFVGAAALMIRLLGLLGQFSVLRKNPLGDSPAGGQPAADAQMMLHRLDQLSGPVRHSRFVRRLYEALDYVHQTRSADTLEDQLERLSEADLDQMDNAYALPRLVRATLPIVGMLGTVIGITLAIGQLSPEQLEGSLTAVMAALSVAFDTTAQAMSLMLVLWFAMFGVEQVEQKLIADIDRAVDKALIGRFQQLGSGSDPNVASIRRMGEQVIEAVEQVTARQSKTWMQAIEETHTRWSEATENVGETISEAVRSGLQSSMKDHAESLSQAASDRLEALETTISRSVSLLAESTERHERRVVEALDEQVTLLDSGAQEMLGGFSEGLQKLGELLVEALQHHGEALTEAEQELAGENRRHLAEVEAALGESMVSASDRQEKLIRQSESLLREMQQSLVDAAGATVSQQEQLVKQGEVLLRVVESTGQVRELEEALNRNLSTLGQTNNLDETLVSLSAAIQLLSARVGRDATQRSTDKAA